MAARSRPLLLLAGPFLLAAVPTPTPRLGYDQAVILAGACLSPALTGCNAAPRLAASASQALLPVDPEPRLGFDLAGLIDLGPQLTGGAGPETRALR